jgi:hypothetical protein
MSKPGLEIMSIARRIASSSIGKVSPVTAYYVNFSLKTRVSSTIPGTRVVRCKIKKAGTNHER